MGTVVSGVRRLATLAGAAYVAKRLLGREFSYAGRVVAITGGSRGLGLALARAAGAKGAKLVLCARQAGELAAVAQELGHAGVEVETILADVAHEGEAQAFVQAAIERFGRLDVLVNCAGIIQVGPLAALGLHDFRDAMAVNFWGTVHTTLAALPELERCRGRIVNVSSIGGAVPVPHLLPYVASKFAVTGFSLGLGTELRARGVTVITVLPGLLRTGSFDHALVKGDRAAEAHRFAVSASLPIVTLAADRAAAQILRACARGVPLVTLGLPWKFVRVGAAVFPSATAGLLSLVNRFLPGPAGDRPERLATPAGEHRTRSVLTRLGDQAARDLNETGAAEGDRLH